MAGSEFKDALKSAADTIANYVKDVATLKVETATVEVGSSAPPVIAASTVIKLDGDNSSVLPCQKDDAGRLTVDSAVYEVHMQNVQAAMDYRARMLDSMLGLLRSRVG